MTAHPGAGVPLCDLRAQYEIIGPMIEEAVLRVLASGQVILGPEVTALEAEIAHYCGTAYGVGCASGTDAVLLALHALEIGPGDEVILPPYTFFATAGMVCRVGARPVFVDIEPDTYNLDPLQVESKITDRTRAIMAVHLFASAPTWSRFGTLPSDTICRSSKTPPRPSVQNTRENGQAISARLGVSAFIPARTWERMATPECA